MFAVGGLNSSIPFFERNVNHISASASTVVDPSKTKIHIYYKNQEGEKIDLVDGEYSTIAREYSRDGKKHRDKYIFQTPRTIEMYDDISAIGLEITLCDIPSNNYVSFDLFHDIKYYDASRGISKNKNFDKKLTLYPNDKSFCVELSDFVDEFTSIDSLFFYSEISDFEVKDINPQKKESLDKATIKVLDKTYTGSARTPATTVRIGNKVLVKGTDYTVSYKNNKNCGKASVTVTGIGKYTGSKTANFIIKPAKVVSKKLTSPKTKTVKLTWTKAKGGVTGYQIVLGLNKKMTSGKKTVWVKKAAAAAKTVKGLKAKKTYYAKVRAYKQVGSKKYYGAWSTIRKAKCK